MTLGIRALAGDELRIDARHSAFGEYAPFYGVKAHDYSEKSMGFAELRRWIEKNDFKTGNSFLEALKAKKELDGIFKTVQLLPYSESSQRAAISPLYPRILMHKDRLFFGMTGNPVHARQYELLEVIEYSASDGAFYFHRVTFPGQGSSKTATFDTKETSCRDCHGKDSRLVWDSYDFWANTFKGTSAHLDVNESALEGFMKKVSGKEATHARYRLLDLPEEGPSVFQNQHLAVHGGMLNFHRIHRRVTKQLPHYRENLYALVAPFARCDDYVEFFPAKRATALAKTFRADTPDKALKALVVDTEKSVRADYQRRIDRFNELHKKSHRADAFEQKSVDAANPDILAKLRFLIEGSGIPMKFWSISFAPGEETGSYHFGVAGSNRFTIYMWARDFLIPDLKAIDAEAAETLAPLFTPAWEDRRALQAPMCAWLKRKSIAALEALRD